MEVEFNHIIAAYDGTPSGKRAIEYGIKLHKTYLGSHLTIVHVFNEKVEQRTVGKSMSEINEGYYIDPSQNQPVLAMEPGFAQADDTHTVVKNSVTMAESTVRRLLSEHQIQGRFEVLEGNTGDSICSYAQRTDASLIIVGESEKSGLKKLFLGSTSSAVIKDSPCPVLIAKMNRPHDISNKE